MNDDDLKFPFGTITGPSGGEIPMAGIQPLDHDPDRWVFSGQLTNQAVVELCRSKAHETGKSDEFLDAVTAYRPYVNREDALAILAIARIGVDPKAVEAVFMMGLQAEREEDAARMGRIQASLDKVAGAIGVSRGDVAAAVVSSLDRIYAPSPHLNVNIKCDFAAGEDNPDQREQGAPCPTNKTTEK